MSKKELTWHEIETPDKDGLYETWISGKEYSLIRQDDLFFVLSAKCPHAGADITKGWGEKNKLVCPSHPHKFAIRTGKGNHSPNKYLNHYPTKTEDGELLVGIENQLWKKIF